MHYSPLIGIIRIIYDSCKNATFAVQKRNALYITMRKIFFCAFTLLTMMTLSVNGQTINGHEYVDLGLSVRWATCNVGAESPEDYGDYYAWGETKTKSSYVEENCETWNKKLKIKGTSRDVAHVKWGGAWRMPIRAEVYELIDNCTWTWTTLNGVNGYKITGRNGNSIFLPAAGYWSDASSGDYTHVAGRLTRTSFNSSEVAYWSASQGSGSDSFIQTGLCFGITMNSKKGWEFWRFYGLPVRPVAEYSDEEKQAATADMRKTSGIINGHGYVDLGLSVNWATCNVGADSPEKRGNYYAWGETKTKSDYDIVNCATWNKSIKTIKGTSRDVAHVKWGSAWRMPTKAEFDELIDNCTWTWTKLDGMNGYKVTSKKNGNSIFFPAAGYRDVSPPAYVGGLGNYWSSSSYESDNQHAYRLRFDSNGSYYTDGSHSTRDEGRSIRPVTEYSVRIDEPAQAATAEVETTEDVNDVREYVDLGLSVKWATCNVGASSPEEYGNYYAWGETKTKSSYTSDNCATLWASISDIKGTSRDVAHVVWGGAWRMPTKAEFDELIDNCTWTWTTLNGVNGYKVTGKNGNSIFLPAVGNRSKTSLYNVGKFSVYWSSTPDEGNTQNACGLFFGSDKQTTNWYSRDNGRTVRPVKE